MSTSTTNDPVGVQQLIDRIKTDGVQEGQQQADAVLAEARKHAAAIVEEARGQADTILGEARQQSERLETNGKRALSLASRDVSLRLKEQLQREFRGWIGGLVQEQLAAPEFLGEVIREMASRTISAVEGVGGTGESAKDAAPGKLTVLTSGEQSQPLDAFVRSQTASMFRRGVEVQSDQSIGHGFRIKIEGKEVEIDFTDEAVTAALMRFIAPKFRQLIGSDTSESANE